MATLMFRITSEKHTSMTEIRPALTKKAPESIPILDKVLEKEPENRYQTGNEFAADLRKCLKTIKKK